MKNGKNIKIKDFAPVIFMLCCAGVVLALTASGTLDLDEIPAIGKEHPWGAFFAILGMFVLKGFSGVVIFDALVAVPVLIYPLPLTILICIFGTAVTLTISYVMGRKTNNDTPEALLERNPKVKRIVDLMKGDYGFLSSFILHLMGLSMEVLGLLFGLARMNYGKYLSSSLLAITPGMLLFILIGTKFAITGPVFWVFVVGNMLFSVLLVAVFVKIKTRKAKKENVPEQ